MSRVPPESGQTTALLLVGVLVLAIPAALNVAQGLPAAGEQATVPTVTPPSLGQTPTATSTPKPTATTTPTKTTTPDGDENDSDGSGEPGETILVDDDGVQCPETTVKSITAALRTAESGDTVRVCPGTYREQVIVDTGNVDLVADGTAVVTTSGLTAVRITAPDVTVSGFDVRALQTAPYGIEVGGRGAVVRGNDVESSGVGIFLSDGLNRRGTPDPELAPAIESRVANNTVTAGGYRIWTDADDTVVRDNTVTDGAVPGSGGFSTPSIVTTGNETVVRNRTITTSPGELASWAIRFPGPAGPVSGSARAPTGPSWPTTPSRSVATESRSTRTTP